VRDGTEHFPRTGQPHCETIDPEFEIHLGPGPASIAGTTAGGGGSPTGPSHGRSSRSKPDEYIDAGDGKGVLLAHISARGKASGIGVERLDGLVWTFVTAT